MGTGFEQTGTISVLLTDGCTDTAGSTKCAKYKQDGFCSGQFSMADQCYATCGVCENATITIAGSYIDPQHIVATVPVFAASHPYYSRVQSGELHTANVQVSS